MKVIIDTRSGFCFGVVGAIMAAEEELEKSGSLYCLGDIVHNSREVERLKLKGLKIIDHETFRNLKDCRVMIRAHGEPPATYRIALRNHIELIDASCPVVLRLQNNVRTGYGKIVAGKGQVVIFGKQGHAEVNGLVGQTGGDAIIISDVSELDKIDYHKDIHLYSQTTMNPIAFERVVRSIHEKLKKKAGGEAVRFIPHNTICRQVSGRAGQLTDFASRFDVILFVSDPKSSNGTFLFDICRKANTRSHFLSAASEINKTWFEGAHTVGISGATSTPVWVMEEVAEYVRNMRLKSL